jgi:hypothetical protein
MFHCHSFGLDSATIAVLPASFYIINLNILNETMVYAALIHNDLDSLWLKFLYSPIY